MTTNTTNTTTTTKPLKILTKNQALIEASGFLLTEPYPENFKDFTESELEDFVEVNMWDGLAVNSSPSELIYAIELLSYAFLNLVSTYDFAEEILD